MINLCNLISCHMWVSTWVYAAKMRSDERKKNRFIMSNKKFKSRVKCIKFYSHFFLLLPLSKLFPSIINFYIVPSSLPCSIHSIFQSCCWNLCPVWCLNDVETSIKSMLKSTWNVFYLQLCHLIMSYHEKLWKYGSLFGIKC